MNTIQLKIYRTVNMIGSWCPMNKHMVETTAHDLVTCISVLHDFCMVKVVCLYLQAKPIWFFLFLILHTETFQGRKCLDGLAIARPFCQLIWCYPHSYSKLQSNSNRLTIGWKLILCKWAHRNLRVGSIVHCHVRQGPIVNDIIILSWSSNCHVTQILLLWGL